MSPDTLVALRRELAGRDVLTVYIDADQHDPTQRASWRLRLKNALDEQEQRIGTGESPDFAVARSAVEAELAGYSGFLPGKAWVLFANGDGVRHVSRESVPLPDLVRWQDGAVLGPLARALRQDRPVLLALIDSLRARLFEYRNGTLEEQVDQRADGFIDDLTDRNMSKRAATSSGMRGVTGTDEAERILRVEMERLARSVANTLLARGGDVIVILGGPTMAVTELRRLLEPSLGTRLHVDNSLHLAMTQAQLLPPVEHAASLVTDRLQESAVRDLLDAAAPGAAVARGAAEAGRACTLGQVETLFFTSRALGRNDQVVESLMGDALDYGGTVELLSGTAAELADTQADGVLARLRYASLATVAASDNAVSQRA